MKKLRSLQLNFPTLEDSEISCKFLTETRPTFLKTFDPPRREKSYPFCQYK